MEIIAWKISEVCCANAMNGCHGDLCHSSITAVKNVDIHQTIRLDVFHNIVSISGVSRVGLKGGFRTS